MTPQDLESIKTHQSVEEIADTLLMRIATAETEDFDRDKNWIKEALDQERAIIERLLSEVGRLQGLSSESLLQQLAHKSQQFLEAMKSIEELQQENSRLQKNGRIESCGEYFEIRPGMAKGRIWIESTGGEGGDFDQDELFMHIREFYDKRF